MMALERQGEELVEGRCRTGAGTPEAPAGTGEGGGEDEAVWGQIRRHRYTHYAKAGAGLRSKRGWWASHDGAADHLYASL